MAVATSFSRAFTNGAVFGKVIGWGRGQELCSRVCAVPNLFGADLMNGVLLDDGNSRSLLVANSLLSSDYIKLVMPCWE